MTRYCYVLSALFLVLAKSRLTHSQVLDSEKMKDLTRNRYLLGIQKSGYSPKGMEFSKSGELVIANLAESKIDVFSLSSLVDSFKNLNFSDYKRSSVYTPLRINVPDGVPRAMRGYAETLITRDNQYYLATRPDGCNGCPDAKGKRYSEKSAASVVSVINASTKKLVGVIPVGREDVVWGSTGAKQMIEHTHPDRAGIIYVANYFSHDISVINIKDIETTNTSDDSSEDVPADPIVQSDRFIKKIKLAASGTKIAPRGLAMFGNGRYLLVAGTTSRKLYIVDALSDKLIGHLPSTIRDDGYSVNFRHIVTFQNIAYFSNMRGNSISRIDLSKLVELIEQGKINSSTPRTTWDHLLIPWISRVKTKTGDPAKVRFLKIDDFHKNHPQYAGGKRYGRTSPNTISISPTGRYLYVSCRSGNINGSSALKYGKVDVIDLWTDKRVFSLPAGGGPTALALSHNGNHLASSAFYRHEIWFYDTQRLIDDYENGPSVSN